MHDAPTTEIAERFSAPGAKPTPWRDAKRNLRDAEIYWLTTVRPDGRPHVTPLIAVWHEGAMCFCTGPDERKAKNLRENSHCVLTTGCDSLDEGLDLVVEGDVVRVTDAHELQAIADAYLSKYGDYWKFVVRDDAFFHEGVTAHVFKIDPSKVLGFRKGRFSQTRWRF